MKRILFICSRNRLRSPTAERIFADYAGIETASAGLASDADDPLSPDHLDGIDIVFVMEKTHRDLLQRRFRPHLKHAKVVCLDIPDDYRYMQAELIERLKTRVLPHLRQAGLAV